MKKTACIALSLVGLFTVPTAPAQGTIYLSNIGETSAGSRAVANNTWLAGSFFTGNASGGYVLNSIQTLMADEAGTPGEFSVSIYSNVLRIPSSNLGSLSGSAPMVGGIYAYSTPGISLSRFTLYFVVLTASNPVATGAYHWSFASAFNYAGTDQWTAISASYASSDGLEWSRNDRPFQFAVYATAVPEPESWLLVLLGLAGFVSGRRSLASK